MSGSAASSVCPDSPLSEAARQLLAELDLLFLKRRKNQARIAHALAGAKRIDLHRACGYSSLWALAWDRYQYGKSKTSELIAISSACQRLPRIRAAFDAGGLHWTKAREITKVATAEDELEWLTLAATSTVAELVAARKGEPLKVQRVLTFTPEHAARFDQALAGIKDRLNLADTSLAVLALLEGGAGEALGESAPSRVVISECGTCHVATQEGREGPIWVEPAVVEAARCAGEVHDLREEENVVTRAIPTKVRRRVLDRDRRRCQVPNCQNLSFLEVHHEGGWKAGHEPNRMVVLCEAHHRQRHEGWLRVDGEAPDFRFRTRVGQLLGADETAGVGAFSYENVGARSGTGGGAALELAELALGRLGLGRRERRRRLREVLAKRGQRGWSAEELVRAVLLAA